MSSKYIAKYPFVYDDVFLIAKVDPSSKRQWLIMQKIDTRTQRVLLEDSIRCIHTAITTLTVEDSERKIEDDNFEKEMLEIRSSENLREIDLEIDEKFFAFKSWVAGIAEAGINAIRIQTEIEQYAGLGNPIANRLFNFLLKAKSTFLQDFMELIEKDCYYEGVYQQACVNANLMKILDIIILEEREAWNAWRDQVETSYDWHEDWNLYLIKDFDNFLINMIELQPSANIFLEKEKYNFILNTELAQNLKDLGKAIKGSFVYDNKYYFCFKDEETGLVTIDLSQKGIKQMKKVQGFERNPQVEQIWIYANKIEHISGLEGIIDLRQIHISNNWIKKIEGLTDLENLEVLDLSYNSIEKIEGLDSLMNLKELYLLHNKIEKLEGVENLKSLEKLVISSNQIQKIEGLENLKNLSYLNLSWNDIETIEGVNHLKNLKFLGLGGNKLPSVEGLEGLDLLEKLDLFDNCLEKMPDLKYLPNLNYLTVTNNRFNKK